MDGTARIRDPLSGAHVRTLSGHDSWVYGVAFSPRGDLIATGSWDDTARIWDAADRSAPGHAGPAAVRRGTSRCCPTPVTSSTATPATACGGRPGYAGSGQPRSAAASLKSASSPGRRDPPSWREGRLASQQQVAGPSNTDGLTADPRHDLARDQLDLAALVTYRPEVDSPAARAGIAGQQLRALPPPGRRRSGREAPPGSFLTSGPTTSARTRSASERCPVIQAHIVTSACGKSAGCLPLPSRVLRPGASWPPAKASGVVLYAEASQPSPKTGDAAQARGRTPASDPQRDAAALLPATGTAPPPAWRQQVPLSAAAPGCSKALSSPHRLVERMPSFLERHSHRLIVGPGRTRSNTRDQRPPERISSAASDFAKGTGPRKTASAKSSHQLHPRPIARPRQPGP